MNKKNGTSAAEKKQYTKPRLRTIELATDEVLAGSCKTSTASVNGPGASPCMIGVPTTPCSTIGS